MAKQLPYREGTAFLIPLSKGGTGRGVVARMAPKGLLLGYFFGPSKWDGSDNLDEMNPSEAVLVGRFGDLHLTQRKWHIIGQMPEWNRSQWPIPEFVRQDPLGFLPDRVVVYSDDNLLEEREELRTIIPNGLPSAGLMGAGYVEAKLEKLLA